MKTILELEKVEKYYGSKSSLTKAINNISFKVEEGEFVAIMGASGSGKTTLLNVISTIDRVTSGHIYVDGEDITALKGEDLNRFRREELGFVFQDFNLLDSLTAYENIALALSIQNVDAHEIDSRVKAVARELNIKDVLDKYPYQMSGGQKQRVASARALITHPKLILADEPTGALDSKSSRMLLEQFESLNERLQATILMVTHDAFAASYASRAIFIKDGKIFNEVRRGKDSRKEFFDAIIDVMTLLEETKAMFFKLALKNIKRSLKDYAIYFFTLALSVAIFYVFNSLESQSVMLDVTDRVKDMLSLMNVVLGVVSVFVSVILGALIIYASRFLIKRRGKEFGIYLTLGMSKRKISLILLIETLLIGVFSLAAGLVLGVVASQFTSILVANMFDADLTNFRFVFSFAAFLKTILYFGIIYLIVMIFNTIVVNRQKLINLLSSGRRNEAIKNKNLWICTGVFIIAAIVLGYAYYMVTAGLENLVLDSDGPEVLLIPIIMGTVSTFLLFWSLSGILLRIVMSFKGIYYKKLNSFVLRQFSSKINTTVASMSIICLMLFVTICVLGSALSINQTLHQDIERTLPMDAQIVGIGDNATDITEIYKTEGVDLDAILKDTITYKTYQIETEITDEDLKNNIGDTMVTINHDENGDLVSNQASVVERYIHVGDYKRLAEIFQLPKLELADNEYAILANYAQIVEQRNAALKTGRKLRVAGRVFSPKLDQCIEGTIQLETGNANSGMVILPDTVNLAAEDGYVRQIILGNYRNPERAEEAENMLQTIGGRFFSDQDEDTDLEDYQVYYYNVDTKQDIIDNNVGTSALVTFVGLYLGIIFLISSAAVLALKELSESSDNRDKYTILRKIGASNSMLNHALFWQIFIFFLFPLLIAVLHSVFGLMFCNFLLSTLGGVNIMQVLPGVTIILLGIYGGYFLITYLCSKNIIREHRA